MVNDLVLFFTLFSSLVFMIDIRRQNSLNSSLNFWKTIFMKFDENFLLIKKMYWKKLFKALRKQSNYLLVATET